MAQVPDNDESFRVCVEENCGECPSFPGAEGEGLYCARGRSAGPIQRKQCICPDCPIWVECGLGRTFYCDQ